MGGHKMGEKTNKPAIKEPIARLYRWSKQGNDIEFSPEVPSGLPEHVRDLARTIAKNEGVPLTNFVLAPEGTTTIPTFIRAMKLVNLHMEGYQEDFYLYDIYKLMLFKEGIWGIRSAGTVFIEIDPTTKRSPEKKKALLEYAQYYLRGNNSTWFHWTPDTLKKVPLEKATSLIQTALRY